MPGGGGGGSTTETTQTTNTSSNNAFGQTTTVDPLTADARRSLIGAAFDVFSRPYTWYPGELTAPFNDQRAGANVLTTALATDPTAYSSIPLADMAYRKAMSPLATNSQGQALATNTAMMNPAILDPRTNPWLAGAGEAMSRNIIQTLNTQTLPQIQSGAVASGQYGSSRQGVSEGLAHTGAAQAIADVNQQLYANAYGQGLDAMIKAQALNPSLLSGMNAPELNAINMRNAAMQQAYGNAAALDQAGAAIQSHLQMTVDRLVQAYNFNNSIPISSIAGLAQVLNSTPPLSQTTEGWSTGEGTSTTSGTAMQPTPQTSPFQSAAAGAAAGYTIGGPWGAAIGAIGGLIFGS